jgi:hypothetical protein
MGIDDLRLLFKVKGIALSQYLSLLDLVLELFLIVRYSALGIGVLNKPIGAAISALRSTLVAVYQRTRYYKTFEQFYSYGLA